MTRFLACKQKVQPTVACFARAVVSAPAGMVRFMPTPQSPSPPLPSQKVSFLQMCRRTELQERQRRISQPKRHLRPRTHEFAAPWNCTALYPRSAWCICVLECLQQRMTAHTAPQFVLASALLQAQPAPRCKTRGSTLCRDFCIPRRRKHPTAWGVASTPALA